MLLPDFFLQYIQNLKALYDATNMAHSGKFYND